MRKSILLFVFLLSITCVFSVNEIEFFNFDTSENLESYKATYIFEQDEGFENGDIFLLNVSSENTQPKSICEKEILYDGKTLFSKIICDVPKNLGENYLLIEEVQRNGTIISADSTNIYISDSGSVTQTFKSNSDGTTQIIINIDSEKENFIVKQFIPKSVIEELTLENKDSLISSSLDFVILDPDPLIAWNVERAPTSINYTIKKEITQKQREDFSIELSDESLSKKLKALILLLFLIVLVLFGRLLFKKK